MRKWLFFVLLLVILIFPISAGAQDEVKLKSVNVQLLSEYDQPSMLVIHEFTVDQSTHLPVKVSVRFPKDVNLHAVAYQNGTSYLNKDYDGPEAQGDWQIVTINVESYVPHRIEYYQPLTREGNKRSFIYRWFGDYPVSEFNIKAQIPSDSTNIMVEPPFSETNPSADGKNLIGIATQNNLKLGQSGEFKISYERESDSVTEPPNPVNIQPAEPIGPNTAGRVSIDTLPWIIGAFGLALIGLALFFYWRSTQETEQKSRRRHRSGSPQEVEAGGEQAYCHECGTRAHPGDRFCRTCGSKLRV